MRTILKHTLLPTLKNGNASKSVRYASSKYLTPTHPDPAPSTPSPHAHLLNTYAPPSLILSHGSGSYLYSQASQTLPSQKYLDFTAGIAVNALGHADPQWIEVMRDQASKLAHCGNVFYNEWAGKLAELLVGLTGREGGLGWVPGATQKETEGARVFFGSTGTEANEGAFKFARKVSKDRWLAANSSKPESDYRKFRITSFNNAFHGRTMGALSATPNPKYQDPFRPLVPGFDVGVYNGDAESVKTSIGADTCAVIVEPIQGEGGVYAASEEWLRMVRKRCDEVGAVLIFDEIQCGLYRTGNLWAHSKLDVSCHPDIITMAKPLANGYPIGAILVKEWIAKAITTGSHGTTFGGSPLATRLGHHVLSRLSEPSFASHVQKVSSQLRTRLSSLPYPIRGRGLLLGMDVGLEKGGAKRVQDLARERGLLILMAGHGDVVRFTPPLTVKAEEVDICADIVESCVEIIQEDE